MSKPLVAVVTPTLNGARYLAEALESVQRQTWPNVVHVVLDNNSSDETPAIVDRFRGGPVPILYFRNAETLPQRANWNKAFGHAPAEATYVRLLCDDDTITPDSVEKMVLLAETDPEIGVVGGLHLCEGKIDDFLWPADQQIFDGREAIRMTLLREGMMMPMHMLWRKSVVDRCDPLFGNYMLGGGFDIDTVFTLLLTSKYAFVHEKVGFTRVHENTVTSLVFGPKTRSWTRDGLDLLRKYGPELFGEDYASYRTQFCRYYVRRLLTWRKADGDENSLRIHLEALQRAGWSFGSRSIADALIDWAFIKTGLRQNWRGYPGWQ